MWGLPPKVLQKIPKTLTQITWAPSGKLSTFGTVATRRPTLTGSRRRASNEPAATSRGGRIGATRCGIDRVLVESFAVGSRYRCTLSLPLAPQRGLGFMTANGNRRHPRDCRPPSLRTTG